MTPVDAGPAVAFGSFAPGPRQEAARRAAAHLPRNWIGRRLASVLLGPAGARDDRPFDVVVFGSLRARLHPADNICEKRVYLTPHHWDPEERAALEASMTHETGPFRFVDVGANAGLYTLSAFAAAARSDRALNALCIEPDLEMRARLDTNLALNGLTGAVKVSPFAVGPEDGEAAFEVNARSRGQSRISVNGGTVVAVRPLLVIVREAGFDRVDALKIDIEGREAPTLAAFFRDAPQELWPRRLFVEVSHDRALGELIRRAGYRPVLENALNAVFDL